MHTLLITFFFVSVLMASEMENIVEKTYPRSNTFCQIGGKSVEFQIRGISKFTEVKDRGFGEYAFFRNNEEFTLLPINQERMDSYEFLPGGNSRCNRGGHGHKLEGDLVAILFSKENSPHKGKLTIQIFDSKRFVPKEVVSTNHSTDKILPYKDGFIFESVVDRSDIEMGQITIAGVNYSYQDRHLHPWISYSLRGFEIQPVFTYENSEWRNFFKDSKDFLSFAGWDQTTKDFNHRIIYIAVNYAEKKSCLLMLKEKQKITGQENWRCRQQI